MKLGAYLSRERLTIQAFGRLVGCSHAHVSRLVNGVRKPSWVLLRRISEVTDGDVTASDFENFKPAPARRLRPAR